MSDIRVSVQWKNSTVFAGEFIECTITFKNIALAPSPNSHAASHGLHRERWKETLPMRSALAPANAKHTKSPSLSSFPQSHTKAHKQALSISSANGTSRSSRVDFPRVTPKPTIPGGKNHRRSVSIISIRGEADDESSRHAQLLKSGRSGHSHMRAASLQVTPRRKAIFGNGASLGISHFVCLTLC